MSVFRLSHTKVTATGVVCASPGYLGGILIATDGANDISVTVHDNASAASGNEIVPTTPIDASAKGFNGFMLGGGALVRFDNGLYLTLTGDGSHEITFYYRLDSDMKHTHNLKASIF